MAQALLVIGAVSFAVNLALTLLGLALIGVWMLVANALAGLAGALGRRLAWLGALIGGGLAITVGLLLLGGQFAAFADGTPDAQSPTVAGIVLILAFVGGLADFVAYPLWLFGLGHRLSATSAQSAARAGEAL